MKLLFIILLSLISLAAFAQDYGTQIEGEWLSASKGKSSNYLFKFKKGEFESELSTNITNYSIQENMLILYEDYYPGKYGEVFEKLKAEGHISRIDTTKFIIQKLTSDSLVAIPKNQAAKQFAYEYNTNFSVYFLDSSNNEKPIEQADPIRFFRRELSYKKIRFDSIKLTLAKEFILTVNSGRTYTLENLEKKNVKSKHLTAHQLKNLNQLLYRSNISYFQSPSEFDWRNREIDESALIVFDGRERTILHLNDLNTLNSYKEQAPWTVKPLFDFLNSLAEKN